MILHTVISGGQTGADVAGLRAARECGLITGGWMPKGFKTLDGPKPEYMDLYGVRQTNSSSYVPRTFENVRVSDATVRIARLFNSAGELCTYRAIQQHRKGWFDVQVPATMHFTALNTQRAQDLAHWLHYYRVGILNVAGNSERTAPGIEAWSYAYLCDTFRILRSM